jgi:hypothetical protein
LDCSFPSPPLSVLYLLRSVSSSFEDFLRALLPVVLILILIVCFLQCDRNTRVWEELLLLCWPLSVTN